MFIVSFGILEVINITPMFWHYALEFKLISIPHLAVHGLHAFMLLEMFLMPSKSSAPVSVLVHRLFFKKFYLFFFQIYFAETA